ncbi:MAG TPA: extracellular solute-binding protein [Gemmataceae bacterium]|nr:extracellular solute-binding protein [Gemmataceae bacterium]
MQLTAISPHRDEIREEFALAFQDWFQERTAAHMRAVRRAVGALREKNNQVRRRAFATAVDGLLADWREDELTAVRAAYRRWKEQPTAELAQPVLTALDEWPDVSRPVELAWQDIGGGTSAIARYIGARFEGQESIGVDVLFGGGTDIYLRFAERKLLQKIDMPRSVMDRIRPQLNGIPLYDPGGRWYGPMLSSFGILYNRRVLGRIGQPEPVHWADLGRPGLRSWVAAGDPRVTGSVHMVYEIILQGQGWDPGLRMLLRMGANTHSFIRDSGTLTRTVSNGEVAAAGNLDANALSAVARDPEGMGFELPPKETVINPDAVAVLKGAPRPQLARAFVEFTLSDAGQRLILLRPGQPGGPRRHALGRLSVVEALYAQFPPETRAVGNVNPFTVRDTIPYKDQVANRRWDALNDLFGAWVVDAHPELTAAWQAVLDSGLDRQERQRLEDELFAPPCSEAELAAHARSIADDSPRVRTATVTRWGEEARERYRRVRRLASGGR